MEVYRWRTSVTDSTSLGSWWKNSHNTCFMKMVHPEIAGTEIVLLHTPSELVKWDKWSWHLMFACSLTRRLDMVKMLYI